MTNNVLTRCVWRESSLIVSRLIRGMKTGGERAWHCWADEGVETVENTQEAGKCIHTPTEP